MNNQVRNIMSSNNWPALAVLNGKLFLVHKGGGSNTNIYFTSFDGSNWAPESIVPNAATTQAVALAAVGNTLYMAHKGGGSNNNIYYTSVDGSYWAPENIVPDASTSQLH
ncbi:hypothetical protein IMT09_03295 [Burkholderia cepacia]|uniref:hypothetical protein n=1 Tax=Burkholderia cepacia TaxID=292 RepID=UPI001866BC0E|nr:hypothetical protein [Burkholderia cepacia]MBE2967142.1 hypothetical protein [Burkholderia cepacia]